MWILDSKPGDHSGSISGGISPILTLGLDWGDPTLHEAPPWRPGPEVGAVHEGQQSTKV